MLMYGKTMFMVEIARAFRPEASLWSTQGVFEGTVTYAAGLSTSGGLTVWLRDIVGRDFEALIDEAAQTPPGADGLVVLPFFGVARSPIFDAQARGAIFGLTLSHGRGHLYRAVLEGSAYEVRHNLEVMKAAGALPEQLSAVGGGTKSGLWTQVVSDVTGLRQVIPAVTIGASFGDAMLAGGGSGLVAADVRWNAPAETLVPDENARGRYDELYRVYRSLYPATVEQAHALALVSEETAAAGRAAAGRS
jgi:xylulokinase